MKNSDLKKKVPITLTSRFVNFSINFSWQVSVMCVCVCVCVCVVITPTTADTACPLLFIARQLKGCGRTLSRTLQRVSHKEFSPCY